MEELVKLDQELFLYLNNLGSETWDWFWVFITYKLSSIPLYAFLLYLLYKNYGLKPTIITVLLVAGLITCTDQLANVFKDYFQRPRPCKEDFIAEGRMLLDYCGSYGYFSAHAASSMALAFYLGNILKRWYKYALVALVFWAAVVGYSRIYVGKHYPGDVITGMLIGALFGFLFYKLQQYLVKRFS
ncbi:MULTISPECIES: phosphatase PAP2 family protein [Mesonia]|uniref:Undecaprenyl-diphosphatase BcrC n=1 Tax=Mesonia oceanica TaxID=2687242 RepID=A0AC61YDG8_9FLAO|nr:MULTISPECIES: phosphatase PAP2 family protein [Mesonia]VVV02516.1 Undecaprenyl-diphosphatase BcrC [Mesonia oceanica]|tara:strand:+ start:3793 stop:4350 length:558 start_codon:yes stop_codon:yes gene_type:complete